MASEVNDILALQDPNLVISKVFKLCITQGDFATLKEGCWLNDKVINFYLSLLMKRNRDQLGSLKVFSFSTFFYSKLQSGEGHAVVKNWTKTQDLFLFDLVFVPLHLSMHWALAVIDFKSQTIQCYDSMGQRHDDIFFVCKYADFLSQGKPLTFRKCDIPVFRKIMVWEITHQKIL
uniref:Ubiquitin-like protease family profile domain-containing protein n=1 Tax=Cyprinus carpio carpio TaxID=630221 RepID=A0A9J8A0K7_CYPCA